MGTLKPPCELARLYNKEIFKFAEEHQLLGKKAADTFIKPTDDAETVKLKMIARELAEHFQRTGETPEETLTTVPQDWPKVARLKEKHRDVERRYQLHGSKVKKIWRSFDGNQRLLVMQWIQAEPHTLPLHPQDRTANGGKAYKIVPDLNIHDMAHPEFDYLLDLLEYRATKSLHQQFLQVDQPNVVSFMLNRDLRHLDEKNFERCYMWFCPEVYGMIVSLENKDEEFYKQAMATFAATTELQRFVPLGQGELIIDRQLYILSFLVTAIDGILYHGSTSTFMQNNPRVPERAARAALTPFSTIDQKPEKLSLPDIVAGALEHKNHLKDYLDLCYEEPDLLCDATTNWFYSRPEAISDEKGRVFTAPTDKHATNSIFELIHSSVTATATWDYLEHLLQILVDEPKDKLARTIIFQEISNVCHLEYGRVKAVFKRYVQCKSGRKYFKRISNAFDGRIPRVVLKIKPEVLTREDPQLHYILRLCAEETTSSKAITWIEKLDDLHRCHPAKRDEISEEELESFGDLAVTALLIQQLSDCLPLPSTNLKKSQTFVSRSKELSEELDVLKTQLDLSEFAVPIFNLLEPGMAEGAMCALDQFLTDKTGTTMGNLYADLVEKCLLQIKVNCQRQKEKNQQIGKDESLPILTEPFGQTISLLDQLSIQQRRQKHKTRPLHSSVYDSTSESSSSNQAGVAQAKVIQIETVKIPPTIFKVKKETFDTSTNLFSKSESRGSISWVAFEAAMTDLMFSVIPKIGSIFTFLPPTDMGAQKSITFHRPHKAQIEGYRLLMFARRLKRVYAWGEDSFVAEAKQHWMNPELVVN